MKKLAVFLFSFFVLFSFSYSYSDIVAKNTTTKKSNISSFFELYQKNREENIPNYITADFVFTAFSIFKRDLITQIEEQKIYPLFKDFSYQLLSEYQKTYKDTKISEGVAYLYILNKLLGNNLNDTILSSYEKKLIVSELKNINSFTISKSSITGAVINYAEFKPAGIYTKKENLKKYYKGVKFATSLPFIVYPSSINYVDKKISDKMLLFSFQLFNLLEQNKELKQKYKRLKEYFQSIGGSFEDLDITVFENVVIFEENPEEIRKNLLTYIKENNKYPQIISFITNGQVLKNEKEKISLVSIRLIPPAFSIDSYIFQNLVYPFVGKYKGKSKSLPFTAVKTQAGIIRGIPTIMDIPSVFNPKKIEIYEKENANYQKFKEKVNFLNKEIKNKTKDLNSIYGYDYYLYSRIIRNEDIPLFKGYYTYSRYNANIYLKQSTTPIAKGVSKTRQSAKIETSLKEYLPTMREQLYFIYTFYPNEKITKFISVLKNLELIIQNSQNGVVKNAEDVMFLNRLDITLRSLISHVDNPISVVVHTDTNSKRTLIESLCFPFVVVDKEFRGARFNHKEIKSEITSNNFYCNELN